jgi:hypothetical protein
MTREELLELVNGKVDTSKFKSLSQKTINEELDDLLDDFGDDESANDKIVTKLANRLKRMDGNLHKNVSDEIKRSQAEAKRREKEKKDKEETEETTEVDPKYAALEEKLNKLLQANEERSKAEAKKAVLNSVKSGLKDKFEQAKLEMNDFFLDTALSKLEIPDEDADISELVSKAERIYTADYKRATGSKAIPSKGSTETHNQDNKVDEHEFDDIVEMRKDRFASVNK